MEQSSKFEVIEGFKCYAPEFALVNDGMSSESFHLLFEFEQNNFWFRSRNDLICYLIKKYLRKGQTQVCEIGCGTGFVLHSLASIPELELAGSEIHVTGLKYAKLRLPTVDLFQADATKFPFQGKYDAVGVFDVLEHIEEDEVAMKCIYNSLKANGLLFVTVPQFQWMWSLEDDLAYHKRRYSRKELVSKLKAQGFLPHYVGSFVFILFPLMALQRLVGKLKLRKTELENATLGLNLPPILNKIFIVLMKIDLFLIKRGIVLPWGGSLVVVAEKRVL